MASGSGSDQDNLWMGCSCGMIFAGLCIINDIISRPIRVTIMYIYFVVVFTGATCDCLVIFFSRDCLKKFIKNNNSKCSPFLYRGTYLLCAERS